MKKLKKWIWIPLVLLLIAGGIGGYVYYDRANQEPVYVYGFMDGVAGMTDYYTGANESSGMVTTDRIQSVYLSSTQTVLEILVEEGQEVRKGDVLFTYDTTLSDIALMQKDLAVQQAKLDLQTAQQELRVINSYVPIRYYEVEVPEPTEPEEPVANLADFNLEGKDYLAYSGSGKTSLTPKYCWMKSSAMIDENMMKAMFDGAEGDVVFVRLQNTSADKADGEITKEYGLKLMRLTVTADDGSQKLTYRFSFFTPTTASSAPVDPGVEWNSGYTSAEIASMRQAKQEEIKNLEFQIKMEEAEYKIMQKEADSGEVLAEFDGSVYGITDPDTASMLGEPLLRVSGGGGYYVEGSVSELELENIEVGQKVDVMSWNTGMTYEGTIVEIGEFPEENNRYYYYSGSQNVSYYPYRIFVDETANLQDGFYVSMTLRSTSSTDNLYINSVFVRTEGASSYVYVRGADGLLEKRNIQVGGSLWGSYTEVRGGITEEDWVAFPYGKEVKEGVPTQEGTWENLYNY